MELRHLSTFRTLATMLSFTKTAEVLDYAQSSVTAQIQALEEDLGVRLFERLGKRVILTEAGRRLLPYAEQVLKLADEARTAVTDGPEPGGTLTIGAPESLCVYRLPPVLHSYRARYPRVDLIFHPGTTARLLHSLHDGTLDVAFILDDTVTSSGLAADCLRPEPLLLLAHPESPLTRQEQVTPYDLAGVPLLLTEAGCSYRVPFERTLAAAGVRTGTTLEFGSVEAIKQCVMAGMGIAMLPGVAVATEVRQGRLAALPWTGTPASINNYLVWHKDKWLSPALRAFLEMARVMLGASDAVAEPAPISP